MILAKCHPSDTYQNDFAKNIFNIKTFHKECLILKKFLESYIFISDNSNAKGTKIETDFFHSLGNSRGRMMDSFFHA